MPTAGTRCARRRRPSVSMPPGRNMSRGRWRRSPRHRIVRARRFATRDRRTRVPAHVRQRRARQRERPGHRARCTPLRIAAAPPGPQSADRRLEPRRAAERPQPRCSLFAGPGPAEEPALAAGRLRRPQAAPSPPALHRATAMQVPWLERPVTEIPRSEVCRARTVEWPDQRSELHGPRSRSCELRQSADSWRL